MIQASLSSLDVGIIIVYALISVLLGFWLGRGNKTSGDYFLASRSMRWPVIGGSLYASNISTTTLVGLSGAAYTTGVVFYNYEWMAVVVLILFAVLFLRVVLKSNVYTMPEFMERRFSGITRTYLALLTLFLNIIVDTAGSLYAGALLFRIALPSVPLWQVISGLALVSGIYTIAGGLAAVMVTDVLQAIILTLTSLMVATIAIHQAGGWTTVAETALAARPDSLSLIRPISDAVMPWPTLVVGVPILGFYFWCTNQFMIQRVLAAKSFAEGRWGVLFAGLLKLPTLHIMVLPGIAAITLYPNLQNGDTVYARLIFDLLPTGFLGLALVGFVAALMSQIDSTLNSASTLVTMDFVRRSNPNLSEKQLMRIGQVATFIFMLLAMAWAPQIERFSSIFQYLQDVLAFAVGPVVTLFVFGVLWPRANAVGAHAAIVVGLIVSIGLFAAKLTGASTMNNLYAAPITAVASALALIVGSLLSSAPTSESIKDLIFNRELYDKDTEELSSSSWWANYRIQAVALLIVTGLLVGWWS